MKTDKIVLGLVVIVFVLLGLIYATFFQQSQLTGKEFQNLKTRMAGFESGLKGLSTQLQAVGENIKGGESERKGLAAQIENMGKSIQQLQNDVKNYMLSQGAQSSAAPTSQPATSAAGPEQSSAIKAPEQSPAVPRDESVPAPVELGQIPVQK